MPRRTTGNMTTAVLLSKANKNAANERPYQLHRLFSSNLKYIRTATKQKSIDSVFFCSLIQATVAAFTG
jgi:hypothetical protein